MAQATKQEVRQEKKWIRIAETPGVGKVGITEDVLAIMAGIAAMDVEGVASINSNATRQLIAKIGIKSIAHGVHLREKDGIVHVKMNLNLRYGCNATDVCSKVQERVKGAIENMTGLAVKAVDVSIAGVEGPDKKSK